MREISIILPVFNEEENLEVILNQLEYLITKVSFIKFEIIAIDDGSTDKSPQILQNHNIRVIHHLTQRGYGAALKTGIKNSNYNYITILDADRTYPPLELLKLLRIHDADLIIGERRNYFSLIRHIFNKLLAVLASFLFGKWITDLNSGMRLFNKNCLKELNFPSWPDGFSFSTTMTLSMLLHNYSIKTVPISCESRYGSSKARSSQLGLTILKTILHFFKENYLRKMNKKINSH
ncbi:MAG: glycosyltransferase family 2 protein [Candidatus Helarchaeota archaeon]